MTTQTLVHSIDLGGEPDSRFGLGFRGYIVDILGLHKDHGKEHGNYYNGGFDFRSVGAWDVLGFGEHG